MIKLTKTIDNVIMRRTWMTGISSLDSGSGNFVGALRRDNNSESREGWLNNVNMMLAARQYGGGRKVTKHGTRSMKEHRRGCSSPCLRPWAPRWLTTESVTHGQWDARSTVIFPYTLRRHQFIQAAIETWHCCHCFSTELFRWCMEYAWLHYRCRKYNRRHYRIYVGELSCWYTHLYDVCVVLFKCIIWIIELTLTVDQ